MCICIYKNYGNTILENQSLHSFLTNLKYYLSVNTYHEIQNITNKSLCSEIEKKLCFVFRNIKSPVNKYYNKNCVSLILNIRRAIPCSKSCIYF